MTQATHLSPATALPSRDVMFLDAARDIALLSEGLIACTDSPLLAVAVPSDRWGSSTPVSLWDQRLALCEARRSQVCDTPHLQPALEALCIAADALFERLEVWGWTHAQAPGLCVISDGTGVAISTRRPHEGDGAGWLLDRAAPDGNTIPILPLDDDGVWGLLQAEASGEAATNSRS